LLKCKDITTDEPKDTAVVAISLYTLQGGCGAPVWTSYLATRCKRFGKRQVPWPYMY
jgi:hypothetical protein